MRDEDRASPIAVRQLMTELMEGVGESNRKLVKAAQTSYGTLGVKEADVSVEFMLSTTATEVGITGPSVGPQPLLGAHTLIGFQSRDEVFTSNATVTLHIVPIATPTEESDAEPSISGRPPPGPTRPTSPDALARAIAEVRRAIAASEASEDEKASMEEELQEIAHIAAEGEVQTASEMLLKFVASHPDLGL